MSDDRKKPRVAHGVQKIDTPNGVRWTARVSLGLDPLTGKQRQKRLSAKTKRELDGKIAETIANDRAGHQPDSALTVAAFLDRWLETITPRLRQSTLRVYRERVTGFIVPAVGHKPLGKLSPADVQRLHARILEAGRAPATAAAVHAVLRSALNDAIRWGLITRNVCSAVRAPRPNTPEMQTWSAEQVAVALRAAEGDPYACLWRLALTTGMRRGELLGLRWTDVDLENRQLTIRHTLVQGKGRAWESGTPKTEKGRRSIAISDADVAALKAHRIQQREWELAAPIWHNDAGLVFTERTGRPVHANKLAMRFGKLIERAGLPRIRFHDCRHSHATLLMESGIHPKVASERLGHSKIGMTLDLYSHVTENMQRDATDRLARLIDDAQAGD